MRTRHALVVLAALLPVLLPLLVLLVLLSDGRRGPG